MWKTLTDTFQTASKTLNDKINGEESTAEYYNPIGQNENHYDDTDAYMDPGFNSKHVAEARLDRAVDFGITIVSVLIGGLLGSMGIFLALGFEI